MFRELQFPAFNCVGVQISPPTNVKLKIGQWNKLKSALDEITDFIGKINLRKTRPPFAADVITFFEITLEFLKENYYQDSLNVTWVLIGPSDFHIYYDKQFKMGGVKVKSIFLDFQTFLKSAEISRGESRKVGFSEFKLKEITITIQNLTPKKRSLNETWGEGLDCVFEPIKKAKVENQEVTGPNVAALEVCNVYTYTCNF